MALKAEVKDHKSQIRSKGAVRDCDEYRNRKASESSNLCPRLH